MSHSRPTKQPLGVNTKTDGRKLDIRKSEDPGIQGLLEIINGWTAGPWGESLLTPPNLVESIRGTQIWPIYKALGPIIFRLSKAEYAFKGVHFERVTDIQSPTEQLFERVDGTLQTFKDGLNDMQGPLAKLSGIDEIKTMTEAQTNAINKISKSADTAIEALTNEVRKANDHIIGLENGAQSRLIDSENTIAQLQGELRSSHRRVDEFQAQLSMIAQNLQATQALMLPLGPDLMSLVRLAESRQHLITDISDVSRNVHTTVLSLRDGILALEGPLAIEEAPPSPRGMDLIADLGVICDTVKDTVDSLQTKSESERIASENLFRLQLVIEQIVMSNYKIADWEDRLSKQSTALRGALQGEVMKDLVLLVRKCRDHDKLIVKQARLKMTPCNSGWSAFSGSTSRQSREAIRSNPFWQDYHLE